MTPNVLWHQQNIECQIYFFFFFLLPGNFQDCHPGVNFINIKRANFLYEFFPKAKMLLEKAAKTTFV